MSGNGTGTVVLTGTLSSIDTTLAALNNVLYHAPDAGGTETLSMTTDDGGNTRIGGPLVDIDEILFAVATIRGIPTFNSRADQHDGWLL